MVLLVALIGFVGGFCFCIGWDAAKYVRDRIRGYSDTTVRTPFGD